MVPVPALAARVAVLQSATFVDPADLAAAKARYNDALHRWKTLRRVVGHVVDQLNETADDDFDVAHEAGVYTDREAGVAVLLSALAA